MGSSSSDDEEVGLQRRRNARSLDMKSSREASKAAAWMWHMHSSSTSNKDQREEKQPEYAIWKSKRRSTSCDRRNSRFLQEAAALSSTTSVSATTLKPVASPPRPKVPEASIWDCGSKLYDTFELVSFSNRLDRSLLGVPAFDTSNFHVAQSPLQHHSTFAGVLRTFSLPRTLSVQNLMAKIPPPNNDDVKPSSHDVINANNANSASDTNHAPLSDSQDTCGPRANKPKLSALRRVLTSKWSFSKLARVLKKVVKFRKQMQGFRPHATRSKNVTNDKIELMGDKENDGGMSEIPCASRDKNVAYELMGDNDEVDNGMSEHRYRAYEEKVNEGKVGKHFHHHHHHYHHHFVHQLDRFSQPAKEEDVDKLIRSADRIGTDAAWPPARAESARLSSDTLSKICADVNWL